MISLIIVAFGSIFQSTFVEYLGWIILVGTWSHLILDSIEDGVMWLWPFTKRRFALGRSSDFDPLKYGGHYRPGTFMFHFKYITTIYMRQRVSFYIEILITLIALYIAIFR